MTEANRRTTAHTDGDVHVWFEHANVVHTGDTYVNGFFPLVDVESGGTLSGIIASAEAILARATPDTKIVPGHGPLAKPADVQRFRDVLVDVTLKSSVSTVILQSVEVVKRVLEEACRQKLMVVCHKRDNSLSSFRVYLSEKKASSSQKYLLIYYMRY